MKIYPAYKEGPAFGFKRLFPTSEYLLDQINSNPTTVEEAQKNKLIHQLNKQFHIHESDEE